MEKRKEETGEKMLAINKETLDDLSKTKEAYLKGGYYIQMPGTYTGLESCMNATCGGTACRDR